MRVLFLAMISIVLLGHSRPQNSNEKILWTVDWNPEGKYIAAGGDFQELRIYSKSLKVQKAYPVASTITNLQWHPTEPNLLAMATQGDVAGVYLVNIKTDVIKPINGIYKHGARGLDWNNEGSLLGIADNEGLISIASKKGKVVHTIKKQNTRSYTAFDWHPEEDKFLVTGEFIRMYDLEGNLLLKKAHREDPCLLLCVQWHPSGTYFAVGDYGDNVKGLTPVLQYWSVDGILTQQMEGSTAEYRNLEWNKEGTQLTSASDALRTWSTEGQMLSEKACANYLWGISSNPTESRMVTSDLSGKLILRNSDGEVKKERNF